MKLCFHTIVYSPFPQWVPCYTLEETLTRLARIGYRAVELAGVRPHAWYRDFDSSRKLRIKKLLSDLEMEVSGITPVIAPLFNPASVDAAERKDSIEYLKGCAELSAELGGRFITCSAGYRVFGDPPDEAYKRSAEALRILGEYGRTLGIDIALEPCWTGATNIVHRSDQAVVLADGTGLDNIGFAMDSCNVYLERESIYDVIRNYGSRLVNVHLEDVNAGGDRLVPGTGILPMEDILAQLRHTGYDGYICVEMLRENDPDRVAYQAYKYLKDRL